MIHFKESGSDMFTGNHQCLINTVNTSGIMGAGIAARMLELYPKTCHAYNQICRQKSLPGGHVRLFTNKDRVSPEYIMMFATKQEIWNPSTYEYIAKGLIEMVMLIDSYNITNVAIPPLGCGMGGLKWSTVREMVLEAVKPIANRCEVYIYEQ